MFLKAYVHRPISTLLINHTYVSTNFHFYMIEGHISVYYLILITEYLPKCKCLIKEHTLHVLGPNISCRPDSSVYVV